MAISLKSILDNAENSGQNPDGSPFDQRSLGYGDNPPLIIKELPGVNKETNGALDLIGQVTDNFVRGGAITLGKSAVDDVVRLGKVLISPNGLAWSAAQIALAKTNPLGPILPSSESTDPDAGFLQKTIAKLKEGPRNRQSNFLGAMTLLTAGTGAAGIRFRKDGLVDTKTESGFNYDSSRGGPKYESSILELAKNGIDDTSDFTLYGKYFNINNGGFEGREDLILSYPGGPHSTFGIGNTEIKRYQADPYRGYLPLFNTNLFELKDTSGTSHYTDYKTKLDKPHQVKRTRIDLYKMGDPGIKMDDGEGYGAYNSRTVDQISAANIFKREDLKNFDNDFKDYIKFRIAVVNTEDPRNDNIILFRALLDNVADSFSGEWNSYKYNGRAEKFYTYGGFDRSISFGFKIHAQTRWEQKPLWRKLNYLVAQTAPEYKNRRMRGVFSRLTIGDWMDEIPGFFTSVNLGWNTAYPWEIRQDVINNEDGTVTGADKDLNEYPHILDVSCEFQPIHNFAPSNSPTTPFILPDISVTGDRKYAKQSLDESADQFTNGVAINAANAFQHQTPEAQASRASTRIAEEEAAIAEAAALAEAQFQASQVSSTNPIKTITTPNLSGTSVGGLNISSNPYSF